MRLSVRHAGDEEQRLLNWSSPMLGNAPAVSSSGSASAFLYGPAVRLFTSEGPLEQQHFSPHAEKSGR